MGSSSCAGSEKRTAAMSETPMNLALSQPVLSKADRRAGCYLRRMPRKVLSLELSSCAFSTGALAGVEVREGSLEVAADAAAAGAVGAALSAILV